MKRTTFALCLLILLVAPIILLAQSNFEANAQTAPSVPEFTVKWVKHTLDTPSTPGTPTTYTVDPFTGENITIPGTHGTPSSHSEWTSLDMTIKNQPFTPESEYDHFYYNIRTKGYYGKNWTELYNADRGLLTPSDSAYTVVDVTSPRYEFPSVGLADFQVQAMIGSIGPRNAQEFASPDIFRGVTSGWSETQTVNLDITPPAISVYSPRQETYTISNVTLKISADEQFSQVKYSLDGGENVSISGSTTITELTNGEHNIKVYATDSAGNVGASRTVYFTIAVLETLPAKPTEIAPETIAIVAILASVAAVGLIVYFKKYRH